MPITTISVRCADAVTGSPTLTDETTSIQITFLASGTLPLVPTARKDVSTTTFPTTGPPDGSQAVYVDLGGLVPYVSAAVITALQPAWPPGWSGAPGIDGATGRPFWVIYPTAAGQMRAKDSVSIVFGGFALSTFPSGNTTFASTSCNLGSLPFVPMDTTVKLSHSGPPVGMQFGPRAGSGWIVTSATTPSPPTKLSITFDAAVRFGAHSYLLLTPQVGVEPGAGAVCTVGSAGTMKVTVTTKGWRADRITEGGATWKVRPTNPTTVAPITQVELEISDLTTDFVSGDAPFLLNTEDLRTTDGRSYQDTLLVAWVTKVAPSQIASFTLAPGIVTDPTGGLISLVTGQSVASWALTGDPAAGLTLNTASGSQSEPTTPATGSSAPFAFTTPQVATLTVTGPANSVSVARTVRELQVTGCTIPSANQLQGLAIRLGEKLWYPVGPDANGYVDLAVADLETSDAQSIGTTLTTFRSTFCADPAGAYVYAVGDNFSWAGVVVVDTAALSVVASTPSSAGPACLGPDGKTLYVAAATATNTTLQAIDVSTPTSPTAGPLVDLGTTDAPAGIAVSLDGLRVYVLTGAGPGSEAPKPGLRYLTLATGVLTEIQLPSDLVSMPHGQLLLGPDDVLSFVALTLAGESATSNLAQVDVSGVGVSGGDPTTVVIDLPWTCPTSVVAAYQPWLALSPDGVRTVILLPAGNLYTWAVYDRSEDWVAVLDGCFLVSGSSLGPVLLTPTSWLGSFSTGQGGPGSQYNAAVFTLTDP